MPCLGVVKLLTLKGYCCENEYPVNTYIQRGGIGKAASILLKLLFQSYLPLRTCNYGTNSAKKFIIEAEEQSSYR